MGLLSRVATYGRLVRFSHTIFALPFAVMGAVLGARGIPDLRTCLFILMAMVGARSMAMAMNRLADQKIDSENPRTASRELPSGQVSRGEVWVFLGGSLVLFVGACWLLNPLVLKLSPIVIVVLLAYPYTKRFTSFCHVWLGAALGLSPIGAFVAVRGEFGPDALAPWLLGGAVVLWTAGFDVIYALLDVDFDRKKKLFSIPSRFGPRAALAIAALMHVATLGLLVAVGFTAGLGVAWWVGVAIVAAILFYEHWIVRPSDLSRVTVAFNLNAAVSVVLMLVLVTDVLA